MGSGHFLVETVDYVTDKALAFLNSFPWNPVTAHLESVRSTILDEMEEQGILIDPRRLTDVNLLKRHVLKRCIYGVDLNPMAVELAKVSLWLHCFTLGAPLSFLDHHMRCGNSLIGVSVQEVQDELRQGSLFGSWFAGLMRLMLATELMRHVGELSDVTTAQVDESKKRIPQSLRSAGALQTNSRRVHEPMVRQRSNEKATGQSTTVDPPVIAFLKTRHGGRIYQSADRRSAAESTECDTSGGAANCANSLGVGRAEALLSLGAWSSLKSSMGLVQVPNARSNGSKVPASMRSSAIRRMMCFPTEELAYDVSPEVSFFRSNRLTSQRSRARTISSNSLSAATHSLSRAGGLLSLIVPMALMGDEQTAEHDDFSWRSPGSRLIEVLPTKGRSRERVFPEAKLATSCS